MTARRDLFEGLWNGRANAVISAVMLASFLAPISASGHDEANRNGSTEQKINKMLSENKNKDALIEAKKNYKSTRESYSAGILYSRVLLANEQLENAILILDRLARKYPHNPEINSLQVKYNNYKKVKELERIFVKKNYLNSIKVGEPLYNKGIDSYRTGIIIAQAEFRLGHFDKSIQVYNDLIKKYPDDVSLQKDKQRIEKQIIVSKAVFLIKKRDWLKAVNITSAYFNQSKNPDKVIGLLLAKAYMQGKEYKQAFDIYMKLAEYYPQDPGVSLDYMNALLMAYHDQEALDFYDTLPVKSKSAVLHAAGGNLSRYYTNNIMVYGGTAMSTRNYPVDNEIGVAVNKTFKNSALYLTVSRWNRFHQDATKIEGIYYFSLKNGYDAYIGGEYSPENNFLAHYGFLAGLSKSIKNINIYGGIRQLEYTALSATVLSLGARYYFTEPASLGLTIFYVPQTTAYSIMLSPEWNINEKDRVYGNMSWGMAGENLGTNIGILNTPSVNLVVGNSYRLTPHIQIGAEAFMEYRKALYNRVGGLGYLRYWW